VVVRKVADDPDAYLIKRDVQRCFIDIEPMPGAVRDSRVIIRKKSTDAQPNGSNNNNDKGRPKIYPG
jgi:hypothetical protein